MIKVTDEMVQLVVDELDFTDGSNAHDEVRRGLAAVLAVVERDYVLWPKPADPFAPVADRDRCAECNDPLAWHNPFGCTGDFGHCDCSGRTTR